MQSKRYRTPVKGQGRIFTPGVPSPLRISCKPNEEDVDNKITQPLTDVEPKTSNKALTPELAELVAQLEASSSSESSDDLGYSANASPPHLARKPKVKIDLTLAAALSKAKNSKGRGRD